MPDALFWLYAERYPSALSILTEYNTLPLNNFSSHSVSASFFLKGNILGRPPAKAEADAKIIIEETKIILNLFILGRVVVCGKKRTVAVLNGQQNAALPSLP
jgi:hypothetical protein